MTTLPGSLDKPQADMSAGFRVILEPHNSDEFRVAFGPLKFYMPDVVGLTLADAAQAWAIAGWYVLPVKPDTKIPGSLVGKGWPQKSSRNLEVIARWWSRWPNAGIAVHTGRSGAVVADLDVDVLPPDLECLTTGALHLTRANNSSARGHYIFASNKTFTSGKLRNNAGAVVGEVRSGNTVIVVAPTPHSKGGKYRAFTGDVPDLTAEVEAILSAKAGGVTAKPVTAQQVSQFSAQHTLESRPKALDGILKDYRQKLAADSDATRNPTFNALCWAARETQLGYFSFNRARHAIAALADAHYASRGKALDRSAFSRDVADAVALSLAADLKDVKWKSNRDFGGSDTRKIKADLDNWYNNKEKPKKMTSTDADEIITEKLSKGQVRMAIRLRNAYKDKFIYVPQLGWHYWDGSCWQRDDLGAIDRAVLRTLSRAVSRAGRDLEAANDISDGAKREAAKDAAKRLRSDATTCQSATGLKGVKEISQKWPEFARHLQKLDSDAYLINLQNCTLNLLTEQVKSHDPQDLMTKVCNASFDADAFSSFDPAIDCPLWNKYLKEVLPDPEIRAYLQRLAGLMLVGTQLEHILPIFTGAGRNGKGVFERVIRHVLGSYAVLAASDLFTSNPNAHSTSQTDLMGARLAVIDETDEGARLSESLVKKMTGGGEHTARRMRQDNVTFRMSHLAIMITNNLPKVSGQGVAIWDRIQIVPFNVYFSDAKRDKHLDEKLIKEADGIFMWAYRGWLDYHNHGGLNPPAAAKAAKADYQYKNDKIQQWMDEACVTGDKLSDTPDSLMANYNDWARINEADVLGKQKFIDLLRIKGYPRSKSRPQIRGVKLAGSR